jgi:hypothetical protein
MPSFKLNLIWTLIQAAVRLQIEVFSNKHSIQLKLIFLTKNSITEMAPYFIHSKNIHLTLIYTKQWRYNSDQNGKDFSCHWIHISVRRQKINRCIYWQRCVLWRVNHSKVESKVKLEFYFMRWIDFYKI